MSSTNLWIYNCLDCVTTAKVYAPILEEMNTLNVAGFYNEVVQPLTYAVMRMSNRGMWVNRDNLEALKREYHLRIHACIDNLRATTGDNLFNPASPDHLRALLFNKLGLVPTKETPSGKESVDELTLKKLAKKHPDNEIFNQLLEYRRASKIYSTYLTNLYIHPDGRIRSRFLVHGTATGRLSSRGPNFQNIPYEVRSIFGAPPGYALVEADASQLELRLIAYASECRKLIGAFENGEDVHLINASAITGKPVDRIDKSERDFAKRFVYCQNYGGSARRISEILFQDAGIVRSISECEGTLIRLRAAYPEIFAWRDKVFAETKSTRIIQNEFGRKRITLARKDELAGVAYNTPIQSTAADYINHVFIRLHRRDFQLVNQVHDSIVTECHEERIDETARALKEEMERPIQVFGRSVVIPCEVKAGNSWGEAMTPWQH